tara:strand:+ start:161 stop:2209 length:2049 start_codon:yes stop_codon:yes gene_type:complete
MASLESFYEDLEKEIQLQKKTQKNNSNQLSVENNNPENNVSMSELSAVDTAADLAVSGAVGVGEGLSYVVDLPFMLVDALDSGGQFLFEKAAMAVGFSEQDIEDMETKYRRDISEEANKIRPGKYLREKFLTYDTKTDTGEYIRTMGEWAAPGGVFAKGAKAVKALTKTGAVSGLIAQGTEDVSGSQGIGVGVGLVTNIGLDIAQLRKGNLAVLSDNILPKDKKTIDAIQKTQNEAQKKGLTLTAGEASGNASIIKQEGVVASSIIGNTTVDTFWKNRPKELKTYIEKWGKEMGIIPANKMLDDTQMYQKLKGAAVVLDAKRTKLWEIAGGTKFKEFTFKPNQIDNLANEITTLGKEATEAHQKIIGKYATRIKKSNGNGQVLQNIYMEIRDELNALATATQKLPGHGKDASQYDKVYKSMQKLLKTNDDWVKAQAKYQKFSIAYEAPITKGSLTKLFNSLKSAKTADSPETIGKMYKYLGSNNVSKNDIIKMSEAVKKSGVPGAFENIVANYFNQRFITSAADRYKDGANMGVIFYDSIMKNQTTRENFSQMLFELAKTKNPKIKLKDIEQSVVKFGNVLKATGKAGQAGSSTAANQVYKETAEGNVPSAIIESFQLLQSVNKFFKQRTFTKNSNALAEAMVSDRGIEALVELAADWKSAAALSSFVQKVTIGSQVDMEDF